MNFTSQLKPASLRLGLALFTVALVAGCANTPPIQTAASSKSAFDSAVYSGQSTQLAPASPGIESFRAFHQGSTGFVSLASVRKTVETMATNHCAQQDKKVRLLEERTSTPPHVLGNFPRVEWVFECSARATDAATASPKLEQLEQLERLKKLLDSGALTPDEFNNEKAKLLSGSNTPALPSK